MKNVLHTLILWNYTVVLGHTLERNMSQKSITAFFSKSPMPRTVKRTLSQVENVDVSNVMTDDKKVKLDKEENLDQLQGLLDCKDTLNKPPSKPDEDNITAFTGKEIMNNEWIENNRLTAELKLLSKRLPALHPNIGLTWFKALGNEFERPYFKKLSKFLAEERSKTTPIHPSPENVWTWTRECRVDQVKVVIIGQDPYHHPGQAHGLSFSVPIAVSPPPSLLNMYKELEDDIEGFKRPGHGYLVGWARQGVLLLNAVLTVKSRSPNSHKDQGWEKLTDAVIKHLNTEGDGIVFLLWGAYAQKKADFLDKKKHHLLKSVHPSPLSASRGFFGCKHFSKCNQLLLDQGKTPIDWTNLPTE